MARNSKWTLNKRVLSIVILSSSVMVLLSIFSIYEVLQINGKANRLAEAYIPEWKMASEFEYAVNEVRYYRVIYAKEMDVKLLDSIYADFKIMDERVQELAKLGNEKNLPVLLDYLERLKVYNENYQSEVNDFVAITNDIKNEIGEIARLEEKLEETQNPYLQKLLVLTERFKINAISLDQNGSHNVIDSLLALTEQFNNEQNEINSAFNSDDIFLSNAEFLLELGDSTLRLIEEYYINEEQIYSSLALLLGTTKKLSNAAYNGSKRTSDETVATGNFVIRLSILVSIFSTLLTLVYGLYTSRKINTILKDISSKLSTSYDELLFASNSLNGSSQMLAQSSSTQASSIEESSSAIEEMASQIKQNAENTDAVELAMSETRTMIEKGNSAILSLNAAMHKIEKSSDETSKILKTIEDIAFQTNLLALNAAVEAARAGEAGKGFAVVAEEVRNLAQRSAEAAKVTAELIQDSQGSSQSGAIHAEETSKLLEKIDLSSSKVEVMVKEISASSKEQAIGIDEMSKMMGEMDNTTQRNAASAEETSSSSEELSAQAHELNHIIEELTSLLGIGLQVSQNNSDEQSKADHNFKPLQHGLLDRKFEVDSNKQNKIYEAVNEGDWAKEF